MHINKFKLFSCRILGNLNKQIPHFCLHNLLTCSAGRCSCLTVRLYLSIPFPTAEFSRTRQFLPSCVPRIPAKHDCCGDLPIATDWRGEKHGRHIHIDNLDKPDRHAVAFFTFPFSRPPNFAKPAHPTFLACSAFQTGGKQAGELN